MKITWWKWQLNFSSQFSIIFSPKKANQTEKRQWIIEKYYRFNNSVTFDRLKKKTGQSFAFKLKTMKFFFFLVDIGLKLKIVPDSWKWIRFWKFGPYWVQKY